LPPPSRRLRPWVLAATFLAAICLPLLGTVFRWGVSSGSEEKRALAEPPPVSLFWRSPTRFYARLRDFLTDGFGFRAPLVALHAQVLVRRLQASPNPKVVLGKDGWLFYAGERAMEDYTCLTPFTGEELDRWQAVLEQRRDWLAARHISYYVVIPPNAQTIYPEQLPSSIRRVRDVSRLDQLLARLREKSTLRVVDLRPALLSAKAREQMYCKTDTHWTAPGALVGTRALLAAIRSELPALRVPEREQYQVTETPGPGGDLAGMLGLQATLQETWLDLVPRVPTQVQRQTWTWGDPAKGPSTRVLDCRRPGAAGPDLLVFDDSFGKAMEPFLSEAFARTVFLLRGVDFDPAFVETVRPRIVVQEFVERHLMADP